MVMAAPRSNPSVLCSSAESQTSSPANPSSPSANGDRATHAPSPIIASTPEHQEGWSKSFEALLIQTALDSLFDGILVVSIYGDILQTNQKAKRLLQQNIPASLQSKTGAAKQLQTQQLSSLQPSSSHPFQPLLDEIWRVCTAVMDSRVSFPHQDIVLDAEVTLQEKGFRIRVRWMNLEVDNHPCLLVTIEDLHQTAINQVNVDRWKYNLTPRETEVWRLKRQGYSYRAIAQTLYVSENTVKKHLKNVQSKRRTGGDWD